MPASANWHYATSKPETANMLTAGELLRNRREAFGASIEEAAAWVRLPPRDIEVAESAEDLSSTLFERVCQALAIARGERLPVDGAEQQLAIFRRAAVEQQGQPRQ